jgi:undecaprenyl diphosphate synthase
MVRRPMEQPEQTSRLEEEVKTRAVPAHVGIIMDGNGRWAELRGLPRVEGHREGSQSVREVTRCARRIGLKALTLYAFSSQNWLRPSDEVGALMALLGEYLASERPEIMQNGIRLNAIGEIDKLPPMVREPLQALIAESSLNTGMVLTLALSYGSREEMTAAARALVRRALEGKLTPEQIEPETFEACLWTAGLPALDLVIRSSGELRLSNFLLWQAAYSEFIFTETLWPDLRAEEFLRCISSFQTRERRFGLTSAQLRVQVGS